MSDFSAALLGGLIGGTLGVIGTSVASYWGPRRLEEWRARQQETREYGPRKELLLRMLNDRDHSIRSMDQLSRVTGTSDEECRRLLIEIGARGVLMAGGQEGWALIERYPLDQQDSSV